MKTANVLASLFFSSLAAAAPVNKRDLFTKTELVVETVVVYTTVWGDEPAATPAAAVPTAPEFYEQPAKSSAVPSSTPQEPSQTPQSSAQAPAPKSSSAAPEPIPTPSSVYTPPAAPSTPVNTPSPVVSTPAYTPSPVASAPVQTTAAPQSSKAAETSKAAPAPASSSAPRASANEGGHSESIQGAKMTIHDFNGQLGACGDNIGNEEKVAAVAKTLWGFSTYNVMTGAATNPWCGRKATIFYQGKAVEVTIKDLCEGCENNGLDLSQAAWNELTDNMPKGTVNADFFVTG